MNQAYESSMGIWSVRKEVDPGSALKDFFAFDTKSNFMLTANFGFSKGKSKEEY